MHLLCIHSHNTHLWTPFIKWATIFDNKASSLLPNASPKSKQRLCDKMSINYYYLLLYTYWKKFWNIMYTRDLYWLVLNNRENSVGIVNCIQVWKPRKCSLVSSIRDWFLSPPKRPHRLWNPFILWFHCHRKILPAGYCSRGVKVSTIST